MFQLLQWGYVNFQSLLSGYGAIYGTFAALPLFMMWLEFSWLIVLLGAEISYAYQNAEHYAQEVEGANVNQKSRKLMIMLVARKIIRNFMEGQPALTAAEISDQLGIPVRLVREVIYTLLNAHIITETLNQDKREVVYQPALDPSRISVSFVLESIDSQGRDIFPDKELPEMEQVAGLIESCSEEIRKSPKNILLRDL
jgi:membrane protein